MGLEVPDLVFASCWVGPVLDIAGCWIQVFPMLVLLQWWVGLDIGVAGCGVQVVLRLMLACSWRGAGASLGVVSSCLWVELGPRVSGCRTLVVPQLVLMHWYVWPGSGRQGHFMGWLWAKEVLRQLTYWWVGLCPCLASYLDCGIPVLVLTGWWVGPGPRANELLGGF